MCFGSKVQGCMACKTTRSLGLVTALLSFAQYQSKNSYKCLNIDIANWFPWMRMLATSRHTWRQHGSLMNLLSFSGWLPGLRASPSSNIAVAVPSPNLSKVCTSEGKDELKCRLLIGDADRY